jgi:hypothetical protein
MIKPPSQQLADVLDGRVAWEDAPQIQACALFFIHQTACAILKMPKEKRRAAINRAPKGIIPILEEEVKRLWRYSNGEN